MPDQEPAHCVAVLPIAHAAHSGRGQTVCDRNPFLDIEIKLVRMTEMAFTNLSKRLEDKIPFWEMLDK